MEKDLGVAITAFCYSNGLVADYRPEHVAMVAKAGYLYATAAHFGCVTAEADRFALRRIGGDVIDMPSLRKVLEGFEYWQRRIRGKRCW